MTRLLTTTEAGLVLGVSRDTVVRLIRSGALPYVDVSATGDQRQRIRISEQALDAWIAAHTVSASEETT